MNEAFLSYPISLHPTRQPRILNSERRGCSLRNGACSHLCLSSKDSYACYCPHGLILGPDRRWVDRNLSHKSWMEECSGRAVGQTETTHALLVVFTWLVICQICFALSILTGVYSPAKVSWPVYPLFLYYFMTS